MKKVTLKIEGMHCGACATGIQMIVSGLDGVKAISVDYEKKSGEVEFDESKVTVEQMSAAVKDLGYTLAVA